MTTLLKIAQTADEQQIAKFYQASVGTWLSKRRLKIGQYLEKRV